MIPLSITLILSALTAWLAWRAEKLIRDYWAFAQQHIVPALSARDVVASEPEPIPGDLLSIAMDESEGWARDATIRAIRDLYDRTGSWDTVRSQLMSAAIPNPGEIH